MKDFDPKSVGRDDNSQWDCQENVAGSVQQSEPARAIIAMGVPDDDELIAAELVSVNETVLIGTHDGMSIRFPHEEVREMGRQAYGVIGIRLDEGDYVVSMIASTNENDMS